MGRPWTRQVGLRRGNGTGQVRHGPALQELHRGSPRWRHLEPEGGARGHARRQVHVAKYKGIRFYDEGAGEGTYFRIRAGLFSWAGKRRGGWLATCDEVPSGDPSEDPVEDIGRSGEYDPGVYIINGTLHDMITAAGQAPGVVMEARDEEEEEEEGE